MSDLKQVCRLTSYESPHSEAGLSAAPPSDRKLKWPPLNGGATQRGRQPATRDNSRWCSSWAEKAGEDCRFRVRAAARADTTVGQNGR